MPGLTQQQEFTAMKKSLIIILAAAGVAVTAVSSANAYTTIGKWKNTSTITMRASATSFPSGSAFRTSLTTSVSRFNQNPSQIRMSQSFGDTSVGFMNGQSEVWFTDDDEYPAVCYPWYDIFDWERIVEADVLFYTGEGWTTSMSKSALWTYGGASRPFQASVLHEYGHAAGLGHENDEYTVMGSSFRHLHLNGSTCRSYLGEDACDGLVYLYGRKSGATVEDVSVVHWKYLGEDGEYATHQLCKMFNTSGTELGSNAFDGQRRYNVTRSQSVRPEFSYENNGETSKTVRVGYYISTNSTISTSDTLIATRSITVNRNDVWTDSGATVVIPSNLTVGSTYYLGVIIDDNAAVSEIDESNNASYHIIRIN